MSFLNNPGFELHISASVVTEPADTPSTVVMAGHAWGVRVEWSVGGRNACLLGGVFTVRAFIDAIGANRKEQAGTTVKVAVSSAPPLASPRSYQATVRAPTTIPPDIYKIAVVLGLENDGVPVPFTALVDAGIVEIYGAR